jgi:hypothetical protein
MFGVLASAIISMSFIGASVKEAYLTLLDLAVALQMISYLYLFASLIRGVFSKRRPVYFRTGVLRVTSVAGLAMTVLGLTMAFVPSRQIASVFSFELKMLLTLGFFLLLASALFFYYSHLKPRVSPVEA